MPRSKLKKFYITTAIPYVNAKPHIGFAMEAIQADVLARYHRLQGEDVFFLTGTDEHGQKIYQLAKEQGREPRDLVAENSKSFLELAQLLNISNDGFIRTTDLSHIRAVQKFWKILDERGDMYKGKYLGYYCVGCEAFILAKDLVKGKCLIHETTPEFLEEENYFFRLSKYSDRIKKLISSDALRIVPRSRKREMLNIIGKEGLKDVSFSRPKKVLNWGVPVPGDENQVMYVWPDALANYITALDYEHEGANFQKYWPCDVHLIGKDILRFHAGIWIGMLLSARLKLPKALYVHGFITVEGQKMSKSLGNVIDPKAYTEMYSVDALRYYLLREIPTTDDGDFSRKRFLEIYQSELVHNFGNLLNRVVTMALKYFDGKVEGSKADLAPLKRLDVEEKYHAHIAAFNLKAALEEVSRLASFGNKFIDMKKPWVLAKEDQDELRKVIFLLLELNRCIAVLLAPFLPETSEKMLRQLELGVRSGKEYMFKSLEPRRSLGGA